METCHRLNKSLIVRLSLLARFCVDVKCGRRWFDSESAQSPHCTVDLSQQEMFCHSSQKVRRKASTKPPLHSGFIAARNVLPQQSESKAKGEGTRHFERTGVRTVNSQCNETAAENRSKTPNQAATLSSANYCNSTTAQWDAVLLDSRQAKAVESNNFFASSKKRVGCRY